MERRGRPPSSYLSAVEGYRKNPAKWIYDVFGIELWEKQEEIIQAVLNNRYVAVKSCFGSGKSFTGACLVLAFLHLYPHSFIMTTAPTFSQLDNIWQEVHRLHDRAKCDLGSRILKHELIAGPSWRAIAISTDVPDNIQGRHAPHVLVIEDESAGIDGAIHERLESLMTGDDCHTLSIGNPLDPSGHFFEMFSDPRVVKMTISAFDTPNVIAGKEVVPGLVTRVWVEERRNKYGEDSPMWLSNVLGEFPPSGENTLIPITWVKAAQERWKEVDTPEGHVIYGLDPSAGGMNETSICSRIGNYVFAFKASQVAEPKDIVEFATQHVSKQNLTYVDEIGVGWGILGMLRDYEFNCEGVNVQNTPSSEESVDRFYNLRAELYWTLREALNPTNPHALCLPPDETLASQLTSIKYKTDTKGKIQIESKKDMRKRGIVSPDRADSLMLTMMADIYGQNIPLSIGVREDLTIKDTLYNPAGDFGYLTWMDYDM